MGLIRKWREYMGPKDEYLEAKENKAVKVGYGILIVGTLLVLYYQIMLQQVSSVLDDPIYTALRDRLVPSSLLLAIAILVSGTAMTAIQARSGSTGSYQRFANVDRIPWDFVCFVALACGASIGVLSFVMRVLAEMQIVGFENVMWLPDIAIGAFLGGLGFVIGLVVYAGLFSSAIKRRHEIERELED
ncbi:hypothetical protein [Adlercreutzia murintestinalis]|jgi:hypothetical protein|uniref:hypothetical protein n=1 Tax=Adlercreutzia murintestinalis TaxID=2941325 RepID=UPI00203E2AD4|nr:hypothetical protein [Adlercreutzia murintestinalis]